METGMMMMKDDGSIISNYYEYDECTPLYCSHPNDNFNNFFCDFWVKKHFFCDEVSKRSVRVHPFSDDASPVYSSEDFDVNQFSFEFPGLGEQILHQDLKLLHPNSAALDVNAPIYDNAFPATDGFNIPHHSGKGYKGGIKMLWGFGDASARGIEQLKYQSIGNYPNSGEHLFHIDCTKDMYCSPLEIDIEPIKSDAGSSSGKNLHAMLLIATLFATITFSAGLHPPDSSSRLTKEAYLTITWLFVLFNSVGYFISMAVIILLLQKYPLKPWPALCAVPLLATYICSVMAILPNQSCEVLFLASSIALFAAAWMCRLGLCTFNLSVGKFISFGHGCLDV